MRYSFLRISTQGGRNIKIKGLLIHMVIAFPVAFLVNAIVVYLWNLVTTLFPGYTDIFTTLRSFISELQCRFGKSMVR